METVLARLAELGVIIPEITLPGPGVDIEKWSVVACDQRTRDRAYWRNVEKLTRGAPSAFNMILPEIYLNESDVTSRINGIHDTMNEYLKGEYSSDPILGRSRKAGVYLERQTASGLRRGFILAIDLERYDWKPSSVSIIRATEGVVEDRLPVRVNVRRNAPLECPHILLLIDDATNILTDLFQKLMEEAPCAYNSPLMMDGGSVKGRFVYRQNDWAFIADTFHHLYRGAITRYGEQNGFLFAVGDGNHSLAAAKAVWEEYKAVHIGETGLENHRARYALVEVVNLYDTALRFEPIHRAVLNCDAEKLTAALRASGRFVERPVSGFEEMSRLVSEESAKKNRYGVFTGDSCTLFEADGGKAATVDLEPVLDDFIRDDKNSGGKAAVDYIHGADELTRVVSEEQNSAGIMLPPFRREMLFRTIVENGPLPRKSFSMGSPDEKRFYLECRKLFK